MLSSALLITLSIVILVLLFRYQIEPLPKIIEIINRVLLGSTITVLVFVLIVFSVHQRVCIEPFIRRGIRNIWLNPMKEIFKEPKRWLIIAEIIELIIILVLIAIFEPYISRILGEMLPGYGMQDLMELYPIRNTAISLLAFIGIVTSFKDQIRYVNIVQEELTKECYNKYKNQLYRTMDPNIVSILNILSSINVAINNVASLCNSLRDRIIYNDCILIMESICSNINVRNMINNLTGENVYINAICKDNLYFRLSEVCRGSEISEDLKNVIKKCTNYNKSFRRFLRKIYAFISLLPFILLPITIAIL
ncbi:MAG: hypothetical protein QXL19_09285 [Ignisphaera sp.]